MLVAIVASLTPLVACVDLDALSRGGARPATGPNDDGGDAGRFCAAHADDLFCDDFDDPGPPGQKWPGIASVLPSPSRFGQVSFAAESVEPTTSPPFAMAFEATRGATDGRPFAAFAKELTNLRAPAVAMSVDVKLVSLTAIETDAGVTDAATDGDASLADADAAIDGEASVTDAGLDGDAAITDGAPDGDAARSDAAAADAAPPPSGGLPALRVPIVGIAAIGPTLAGVQVVASHEGLFVVVGLGESTIVRARISDLDYVSAASVAWTRITLVVGDPASVEAFAARETKLPVECPRTTAAVAVWPTLPPNLVQCVPAAPGYADTPDRRLAATIGVGLESPSKTRVLFDNVRVVPVPAP